MRKVFRGGGGKGKTRAPYNPRVGYVPHGKGGRPKGVINTKIKEEVELLVSKGEFSGLCYCGCAGYTEIADKTRRNKDKTFCSVAGYPKRYIKGHSPQTQKGEDSPFFKGTRRRYGFVYLYKPDHPRAVKGYVQEHVLVVEKRIGRYLKYYGFNHKDNEIVHHRDKVRDNNKDSNLKLLTGGEHSRIHREEEMSKPGFKGFGCHAKGYGKVTRKQVLWAKEEVESGRMYIKEVALELGVVPDTIGPYISGKKPLPKV